ncbi:MAG: dTDP-4-dehydrorhamnose 3,5-epimerase family protein [Candidatus Omnitrophota bacterium]|nr:MAG: dTDP-4-dehydrorhamnose 3,5-epimerase family protein [Candidatus Omnitrophota bacterium]
MIEGVKIKKLKIIPDERGRLMEILRSDDELFEKFGQVYMTTVKPGVVKAWHYHQLQRDNFCCVRGKIRLGLYDARKQSPTFKKTMDIVISMNEPKLVSIPMNVYHGFKGIADEESIIINTPTEMYNHAKPDEYRIDAYDNDIPFDWRK